MGADETPAGPPEIQPTVTRRREKVKNSVLHSRLLMVCENCHREWELPTLWALAADNYCHGLCQDCQSLSLNPPENRRMAAELRVVSKGLESTDRN
jgi:hypothetical protein